MRFIVSVVQTGCWLIFVASCLNCLRASDWQKCDFRNETAWESSSGEWLAIVSANRGRLVFMGPRDRSHNFLYLDEMHSLPQASTWGGHRFWLGPQTHWKQLWPPPPDWEKSASTSITIKGACLSLMASHKDSSLPQLYRSYEWCAGSLHIVGSWCGNGYEGIHILQLPVSASISLQAHVTPGLPEGFCLLPISSRPEEITNFHQLPKIVRSVGRDKFIIRNEKVEDKLGFAPQTLLIREGRYELCMARGDVKGEVISWPNSGLLTQVYSGDESNPYMEAEQLSPVLNVNSHQNNEFAIDLTPCAH